MSTEQRNTRTALLTPFNVIAAIIVVAGLVITVMVIVPEHLKPKPEADAAK